MALFDPIQHTPQLSHVDLCRLHLLALSPLWLGDNCPGLGKINFNSPNPSSFPVDPQPGTWTDEETWTCGLEATSHTIYHPDFPGEVIESLSAPSYAPPTTYPDLVIEIVGRRSDPKSTARVICLYSE